MITEQVTCLNLKMYSTSAAEPCSSLVKATAPKQKMTQENDMSPYDHSDHEQLVSALDRFLGQQVLSFPYITLLKDYNLYPYITFTRCFLNFRSPKPIFPGCTSWHSSPDDEQTGAHHSTSPTATTRCFKITITALFELDTYVVKNVQYIGK